MLWSRADGCFMGGEESFDAGLWDGSWHAGQTGDWSDPPLTDAVSIADAIARLQAKGDVVQGAAVRLV